jgi:hypothetical protein
MYQRDSWQEVVSELWNSLHVLFSTRAGPLVERARRARGRAHHHIGRLRSPGGACSSSAAQYSASVECAA